MPSFNGVAMKNWPNLFDFKALTGKPLLSLISRITLGNILPFSSKVIPAIRLGLSGGWGKTRPLAKTASVVTVVWASAGLAYGVGLTTTLGLAIVLLRVATGFAVGAAATGLTIGFGCVVGM